MPYRTSFSITEQLALIVRNYDADPLPFGLFTIAEYLKVIAPFTNIENKPHITMAKGEDRRKEEKKKPLKTLKEKRAEKQAKKANRS
ncbi:MAG TPA: hypothetical protein VGD40_16730 [Chryseosolibacter sp.]